MYSSSQFKMIQPRWRHPDVLEQWQKRQGLRQTNNYVRTLLKTTKNQAKEYDSLIQNIVLKSSHIGEHQSVHESVKNKIQDIKQSMEKRLQVSQTNEQIFSIKKQIVCAQKQKRILELEQTSLSKDQQILLDRLNYLKKTYPQIQDKIATLRQAVQKRERTPNIDHLLRSLIDDLKQQYPNEISEQDVRLIENQDINSFSLSAMEQIKTRRLSIQSLTKQILNLQAKYFEIEQQMKDKQSIEKSLLESQSLNLKLHQSLKELKDQNNFLEANMDLQVQKVVDQKISDMNDDNLAYVKKYLVASQFLVERFGGMFQKNQFQSKKVQISYIRLQSEIKRQQMP